MLDHHSASHWAPLYDVHANAWIDEWAERAAPGLELPRLVWPQDECGAVTREAAAATGLPEGTPVGRQHSTPLVRGGRLRAARPR